MTAAFNWRNAWHRPSFTLRTMPRRFSWLTFGFGAAIGFLITLAANVALKLATLVAVAFGCGFLLGRYWLR